jgi:hypothetical protein
MSRRDDAIVAWHEVPGKAPPQKSRPVGHGGIRAGARPGSKFGVPGFDRCCPSGPRMQTFRKNHLAIAWCDRFRHPKELDNDNDDEDDSNSCNF